MRVTLLGTGGSTGVPMIGGADGAGDWGACDPGEMRNWRTRSSILIEHTGAPRPEPTHDAYNQRLLIDTSPDMRLQFIANRIPGADAILFTHAHADHITGIDDVRVLNRIANRPLEAFATQGTLDEITKRFGYAFAPWDGNGFYRPVLSGKPVSPGDTVHAAGFDIRLFSQGHGRIETLGLRIGSFAYSTDVVHLDEAALNALEGIDTWVVGCFLRQGPHWTHADLPAALGWIERLRPRRTVLTHMGTDMDWAWLRANLPPGVEAGYDGMVLDITPDSSTVSNRETPE
jgi:phosphoribosyl 1,2-cyclic phosphate phosphodiesterase